MMFFRILCAAVVAAASAGAVQARPTTPARNALIFVADGLRADSVNPKDAPMLAKFAHDGVEFRNPHSLYPTITTVNASAIATGHYIGDTGNFGNQLYTGFAAAGAGGSRVPFLENDEVLGEMNAHFGGNYLHEESLLAAARKAGLQTAALGKTGAAAIQDVTARDGASTIVIDDSTGTPAGIPVSPIIAAAIKAAGLPIVAPKSAVPNAAQQSYLLDIATKVVLPAFKRAKRPFVMVFWSRDPDYSQHSEKDGSGSLSPGINGPSGKAGIKDTDDALRGLIEALRSLGLQNKTDVFVTADHGFSTLDNHSHTSASARYKATSIPEAAHDEPAARSANGELHQGFLAIDLADALKLPLFEVSGSKEVDYRNGQRPAFGNGLIGQSAAAPDVIVAANGGSDEIWLPGENSTDLVRVIARVLSEQDYVSGIFVNDSFGEVPGTLPLRAIALKGSARTPEPSIVVNFRSHPIEACKPELLCSAEVADTSLVTGQGMHGTFSRADTKNFMAATGPDFRSRFVDSAPVGNADVAPTIAHLLHLSLAPKGRLTGRVISEGLRGGNRVRISRGWLASNPAANGLRTILTYQQVGGTRYFDAAGYPGRTVGLVPH